MPAKSRRNRRNISQSAKTTVNRPVASSAGAPPVAFARPEVTVNTNNPSARNIAVTEVTYPYIFSEIKWIGLVTLLVAVILVILYVFLH